MSVEKNRKFKVGVFGSADGNINLLRPQARKIGFLIVRMGGILVTGACPGLPHEAALGAHETGGMVVGISPAMNLRDHTDKLHFPSGPYSLLVFTGFGNKGRNVISTRTCDAAIFISGRIGTLNEFTLFWDEATEEKVIGFLQGSGGVVDNTIPILINTAGREKPSAARQVWDYFPEGLVEKVFEKLNESKR